MELAAKGSREATAQGITQTFGSMQIQALGLLPHRETQLIKGISVYYD